MTAKRLITRFAILSLFRLKKSAELYEGTVGHCVSQDQYEIVLLLWEDREVSGVARKHKLSLAGLKKPGSRRYYENKFKRRLRSQTLEI